MCLQDIGYRGERTKLGVIYFFLALQKCYLKAAWQGGMV